MKIVNKHGRWWKGLESEWAVQDGTGNWWLYRNKKNKTSMKMPNKKRSGTRSAMWKPEHYLILALAAALGISLGINVFNLLS